MASTAPFKATALFLGVFALQFALVPQFLMDQNFNNSPKLDEWHLFIMRPFGVIGLFLCYLLWNMDGSDKVFLAAFNVVFSASLPWYAHATKDVKMEHWVPTGGTILLALWSCANALSGSDSKAKGQ